MGSLFQTNSFCTSLCSTLGTSKVYQVLETGPTMDGDKSNNYSNLKINDLTRSGRKKEWKASAMHTRTDTRTASQELPASSSSLLSLLSIIYVTRTLGKQNSTFAELKNLKELLLTCTMRKIVCDLLLYRFIFVSPICR